MSWSWLRQGFQTRTIVLMPIAIAINLVLGQAVGSALRIPLYLDSIGTILLAVLAGPVPGLVTGLLSDLVWSFIVPPPFHSDTAWAFAPVGALIGLIAGLAGRLGLFRSRRTASRPQLAAGFLVAAAVIVLIGWYGLIPFYADSPVALFSQDASTAAPIFILVGYGIVLLVAFELLALLLLLIVRRDLGIAVVLLVGLGCGIASALVAAPIAATVYGGVTGSGTDLLVAAFQQAGSDLSRAVLQQGLLSDPIDKTFEFLLVYAVLQVVSRRFVARFPQGERIVGPIDGEAPGTIVVPPEGDGSVETASEGSGAGAAD